MSWRVWFLLCSLLAIAVILYHCRIVIPWCRVSSRKEEIRLSLRRQASSWSFLFGGKKRASFVLLIQSTSESRKLFLLQSIVRSTRYRSKSGKKKQRWQRCRDESNEKKNNNHTSTTSIHKTQKNTSIGPTNAKRDWLPLDQQKKSHNRTGQNQNLTASTALNSRWERRWNCSPHKARQHHQFALGRTPP